jgi:hypothetical protein
MLTKDFFDLSKREFSSASLIIFVTSSRAKTEAPSILIEIRFIL